MSNTTLPPSSLPGVWRLVQPPADVISASDAIVSACAAWKPTLVEGGVPLKATPEEAVCHAVQDWSAWNVDRSVVDGMAGFSVGVAAGLLLCLVAILTWRVIKAIASAVGSHVTDQFHRLPWSGRRRFGR